MPPKQGNPRRRQNAQPPQLNILPRRLPQINFSEQTRVFEEILGQRRAAVVLLHSEEKYGHEVLLKALCGRMNLQRKPLRVEVDARRALTIVKNLWLKTQQDLGIPSTLENLDQVCQQIIQELRYADQMLIYNR